MKSIRIEKLIITLVLLGIVLACSISFNTGKSEAEKTLEAIYLEDTQTAVAALVPSDSGGDAEPDIDVEHSMIPGSPGTADQIKDEIDTENTADTRTALGDSFRLGNFERPFTAIDMLYHPETDLIELQLSKGTDFYYFTFELNGADEDANYPNASYGIEIDTDYDGRGDYLLWAIGDGETEWNIRNVMLLEDSNDDVGGSNPVVPDNNNGNGYDFEIFSANKLNDPDVAWKRLDPNDNSKVTLAVKISYIDKNRFYWKAWADAGTADPTQFDYNDTVSESQAGSPNKNSEFYPIDQLNLMDSTCWIAYNLEATGTELGGCYVIQPTQPPPPPGCNCSTYVGLDQTCCIQCGYAWSGTVCYDPPH